MARAGGEVLFLGAPPRWIAGRTIRDARDATASDFKWAKVLRYAELPPTPTPPQYPPDTPPQAQLVPADTLKVILSAASSEVRTRTPQPALRVMKRRWKDADVYLLFNEGAQAIEDSLTITGRATAAEIWDPQAPTIAPLRCERARNGVLLNLMIPAYETRVLVLK
jgi:hypothetical protein